MPDLSIVARWAGYVAALGLTGAATFHSVVRRRIQPQFTDSAAPLLSRTRQIGIILAALLLGTALFRLVTQVRSLVEPGEPVTADLYRLMLGTTWGHNWWLQVGAALVGLLALLLIKDGRALIPLAVLVAFLAPLTGHASENPLGSLVGIGMHGMHQLGGGIWLGTLAMVVLVGYGGTRRLAASERHQIIARLVEAFSPLALAGVTLAVLAGVALSIQYVGSIKALVESGYGKVLLIKVALLALTAMLGAWNWRRVRPTLGEASASSKLLRSATLELIIGTLLLGATALLVGVEAPGLG